MKYVMLIVGLFLVSGCCSVKNSEKCAKKKIQKALKHHPSITDSFTVIEHDTLIKHDTILSEQVFLDTLFQLEHDTVFTIKEGKVTTQIKVVDRDVIRVQTRVESDTIILTDTIVNERIKEIQVVDTSHENKSVMNSRIWFFMWCMFIMITAFLFFAHAVRKFGFLK